MSRAATHEHAAPMHGVTTVPFFTPGVRGLAVVALAGLAVLVWRFARGIGAVTNLSDQYPWGIWIGIDVATGVALAAGGFTSAFIAHVLHQDRFHSLVRPALLTAMLGYTFVAIGVVVDLGRYYNMWHILLPPYWQGNSALFEVGMCVATYLTVLYIEFLPIVCERFIGRVNLPGAPRFVNRALDGLLRLADRTLGRVMTIFIMAGVVLSCMHQSSLGTLMVIAPSKLHPLWHTAVLPLQFLLSAFAVGLAMVIFESLLAARSLRRPLEMSVLAPFARFIPFLLTIYLAAKVIDLVDRGAWVHLGEPSVRTVTYLLEMLVGVLAPLALLLSHRLRRSPRWLFAAAAMIVGGVALNRANVFLIGYTPPYATGPYVPSWSEVLVTAGLISLLVLVYRLFVFHLPVMPAEAPRGAARATAAPVVGVGAAVVLALGLGLAGIAGAAPPATADHPHGAAGAPDCRECHACERPTRSEPCLEACPRHRNNFTGQHSSDEGPAVVVIDQLADLYQPVVFAHGLHATMSEMTGGCVNCHHYSEPGGAVPPCRQCHDPAGREVDLRRPSLKGAYHRQCINCHLDWSHENSCASCHEEAGAGGTANPVDRTDLLSVEHPRLEPTPYYSYQTSYAQGPVVTFHHTDHVETFGLDCTACHQGQSCSRCHDVLKSSSAARPPLDRGTSCIVCHAERDCAFCHSTRSEPAFHHATSANFSLAPHHGQVACKTCHGEPKSFRTPSPRCTSCHIHWQEGAFDHRVTGVVLDETHRELSCADCHADGDFARDPACDACHEGPMFPGKLPGERLRRVSSR